DSPFVCGGEAEGDLNRIVGRTAKRKATRRERLAQSLAFEKLHDGISDVSFAGEIMEGEDVRMRQCGYSLRFALEARQRLSIVSEAFGQHLDGDVAPEARVSSFVDLAHPSRTEWREDLVGPEPCPSRDQKSPITNQQSSLMASSTTRSSSERRRWASPGR